MISARIEDKVYGRVFVGSTFRPVHKRIENRSFPYFSLPSLPPLSLLFHVISFQVYSRTRGRPSVKTRRLSGSHPTHFTRVNRAKIYCSFCFVSSRLLYGLHHDTSSFLPIHPTHPPASRALRFPSARSRAYFVNHPAKFAPEQDVYGCQLIGSKCSENICPIFFPFSFFFFV